MNFQLAIETQRRRLFRFLAGLSVAIEFLSLGSIRTKLPRWFTEMSLLILRRAEIATECLVIAESRVLAQGSNQLSALPALCLPQDQKRKRHPSRNGDAVHLQRRIRALLKILGDLKRHALGRMRLEVKRIAALAKVWPTDPIQLGVDYPIISRLVRKRSILPRVERPPDKASRRCLVSITPSH